MSSPVPARTRACFGRRGMLPSPQTIVVLLAFLHSAHSLVSTPLESVLVGYGSNEMLARRLDDFVRRCGHIARLHTIGSSAKGTPLRVLELAELPGQDDGKPHFKYIGNLHGDEPTGRVLTMALAEDICEGYKSDGPAADLIRHIHLWLVPTLNPDGFEAHTRENGNAKDLNRNFPDRFASPAMEPTGDEEPEVKALMDWSLKIGFTASAALHEGALVANYPWDGTNDTTTRYEACPDDQTFQHLASQYATAHKRMALSSNHEFPDGGTTNGAAWYPIYGSMQDWNYIVLGCFELTLELSESKWPGEGTLGALWAENRAAMLTLPLVATLGGIRGMVKGENPLRSGGIPTPIRANITVDDVPTIVQSHVKFGTFFRPLSPGRHSVRFSAIGYAPRTVEIETPDDGEGAVINVVLERQTSSAGGSDRDGGKVGEPPRAAGGSIVIPGLKKASRPFFVQPAGQRPIAIVALALSATGVLLWVVRLAGTNKRRKLIRENQ